MNKRVELKTFKYPFHKNFKRSPKLRRKFHRFYQRQDKATFQHDKEVEKGNTPIVNVPISRNSKIVKYGRMTKPFVFYPDGNIKWPCGDVLHGKWIHTINFITK